MSTPPGLAAIPVDGTSNAGVSLGARVGGAGQALLSRFGDRLLDACELGTLVCVEGAEPSQRGLPLEEPREPFPLVHVPIRFAYGCRSGLNTAGRRVAFPVQ